MALSLAYTFLAGDAAYAVNYKSSNTPLYPSYPEDTMTNMFGALYLPRVYGKDLTSFEVASSGNIAFTINDVHTLALNRTSNSLTSFVSVPDESMEMRNAGSTARILFDTPNSNLVLSSSNQLILTASNGISMDTPNINLVSLGPVIIEGGTFAAQGRITIVNSNISAYAPSNVAITASNDVIVVANSNVRIDTVTGNIALTSASNVVISGGQIDAQGSITIMDSNVNIFSDNDVGVTSSNDVVIVAMSNIYMDALTGSVVIVGGAIDAHGVIRIENSNVSIYADSNVAVTASNDVIVIATSNISLGALTGSVLISGGPVGARGVVTIEDSNVSIYADRNVAVTASNDVIITATSNIIMEAVSGSLIVSAHSNINVNADTGSMTLTADNGGVDITMSALDDSLTMTVIGNIVMSSAASTAIQSTSDVYVTSIADSVFLNADNSNVYLYLYEPATSILGFARSNVYITSSNDTQFAAGANMKMIAKSNVFMTSQSGGATVGLSNTGFMWADATAYRFTASSNYMLNVGNNNVMKIGSDKVTINAHLDVLGTVNSISITETELRVQDKTIQLASIGSNGGYIYDGIMNTGAGIVVNGMPSSADSNTPSVVNKYQKSLLWSYNSNGVDGMMTNAGITNESYWELKGGSLRLTAIKSDTSETTYAFRINEFDELELVRRKRSAEGVEVFKRVARFGRDML